MTKKLINAKKLWYFSGLARLILYDTLVPGIPTYSLCRGPAAQCFRIIAESVMVG